MEFSEIESGLARLGARVVPEPPHDLRLLPASVGHQVTQEAIGFARRYRPLIARHRELKTLDRSNITLTTGEIR